MRDYTMEKREVKKTSKSEKKINFYFTILELFKQDKTTSQIAKELNISKQKLYYHTTKLRDFGFLQKEGYGVWKVLTSKKADLEQTLKWKAKQIRGHAFIWRIKSERKFNWIPILEKKNIPYKLVRGYTPRIIIKNQKIWLAKDSIIVYDNRSFYGENASQSRKYAVWGLLSTLSDFSKKVGLDLGKYYFKPTREHYGMIKNELARQCNKKGEKIVVRDDLDGEWLWIDDSIGMLGELETGGKGFTKDRASLNMDVQKWYNDHKSHNFKVTPTFVLNTMNGIQQNQQMFAQNIETHIEAIQTLSQTVKELKEEIRNLKNAR